MPQPKGFLIDVPVTLTVAVRGGTEKDALKAARAFFAEHLEKFADDNRHKGYSIAPGVTVTEFSMESPSDEVCEVLEELDAETD